jgi:hypothetical protein
MMRSALIAALFVAAQPYHARFPVAVWNGTSQVGALGAGGAVTVVATDGGWAQLAQGGTVLLSALAPGDVAEGPASMRWGAVRDAGATVRAAPREDAAVLFSLDPPHTIAVLEDDALRKRGWLPRVQGGYVQVSDVWLDHPSDFRGIEAPALPLALTFRDTALALPPPFFGATAPVKRREPFAVLSADAHSVETPFGVLPRAATRLITVVSRPDGVPARARWVHVDVREQTLTAYEGDVPVYATLISSGLADEPKHKTHPGLYRVWLKSLHDRMHGESYFVEEVPFILYFRGGQGLHGTFWHDRFGQRASHGCVNLSMADAAWLFAWSPPALPDGWSTVYPLRADLETLFVHVEEPRQAAIVNPGGPPLTSWALPR